MAATHGLTLALDAMGGDEAPNIVIDGAAIALKKYPDVKFIIYGDENKIKPLIAEHPELSKISEIIHTEKAVRAHDKPSLALRNSAGTSMRLAIEAVKNGKANGVVSAGNTGALMAISKTLLKTIPGISRPAIAGIIPNRHHDVLMLDLGANVECNSTNLVDFAIMGDAFARNVLGRKNPALGLLNIGSEEMKGHDELKEAYNILKEHEMINLMGYVEGNELLVDKGFDIVITDGFTGNIALKTMEGAVRYVYKLSTEAIKANMVRKIAVMCAYPFFKPIYKQVKRRADPRKHNGAMFLGLNGIVVKSHGGADEVGFYYAISEACRLIINQVNDKIMEELSAISNNNTDSSPEEPKAASKEVMS